jgi:outer membrane protein OmpA-like peptidoglycan-associated protein
MKKYSFSLLLAGLLIALVQQVEARENVRVYSTAPSAAELARALGVDAQPSAHSAKKERRTRRIVFDSVPAATPPPQQHDESSASSGDGTVLAFPLYFRSGSAALTSQAIPFIDSVGGLMKMDPSLRFQIEGHTDSIGSAARNLELSHSRAISVTDYLINRHAIDSSRLVPVGKGSQEPLQGVSPRDPSNRRVQFRKMG